MKRKRRKRKDRGGAFLMSATCVSIGAVMLARRYPWLQEGHGLALLICGGFMVAVFLADSVRSSLRRKSWGFSMVLCGAAQMAVLAKVCFEVWFLVGR